MVKVDRQEATVLTLGELIDKWLDLGGPTAP